MNAIEMHKCLQQAVSEIRSLAPWQSRPERFLEEAVETLKQYLDCCDTSLRKWVAYQTHEGWFVDHSDSGARSFVGQSEIHARMVAAYRNGPAVPVRAVSGDVLYRMRNLVHELAARGAQKVDMRSSVGMARRLVEEDA